MTLDGSGSISNVTIVSYVWTFTDGTPKSLSGETVTYNFTDPGTYQVTLKVTDAEGRSSTDTLLITVKDVTPPVAAAGTDRTVKVNTEVSFDATGSGDNVGIVSFEWDFGDGTTRTGATAQHRYAKPGAYAVTLTVRDAVGNSATEIVTVTVTEERGFSALMAVTASVIVVIAMAIYLTLGRKRF